MSIYLGVLSNWVRLCKSMTLLAHKYYCCHVSKVIELSGIISWIDGILGVAVQFLLEPQVVSR